MWCYGILHVCDMQHLKLKFQISCFWRYLFDINITEEDAGNYTLSSHIKTQLQCIALAMIKVGGEQRNTYLKGKYPKITWMDHEICLEDG